MSTVRRYWPALQRNEPRPGYAAETAANTAAGCAARTLIGSPCFGEIVGACRISSSKPGSNSRRNRSRTFCAMIAISA
jgi:hypothetical protein